MANALFDSAREAFLSGTMSWSSDDIRCALLDATADASVDVTLDVDRADYTNANEVAVLGTAFAGKSVTDGIADANDITFTSVTGAQVVSLVIYENVGTAATDLLIAYIDTAASGLPVTPNGGDITVSWSDGTNKIFKL